MIKAKIENDKETQYLELPCDQETLNAKIGGGSDEIKVAKASSKVGSYRWSVLGIASRPSTASADFTRTCRQLIRPTFRTP